MYANPACMENRPDYNNKIPLAILTDFTANEGFTQIVNFKTWSRTINGIRKESLLDHIYTNNSALIDNVHFDTPHFGDHVLAIASIPLGGYARGQTYVTRRSWWSYSEAAISTAMSGVNF